MNRIPRPQEIYKHFKGNLYQIITLAEDSENGQKMVVYQSLYGDFKVYVRPLEMFVSKVDKAKYPAVEQEYRFERLTSVGNCVDVSGAVDCLQELQCVEVQHSFASVAGATTSAPISETAKTVSKIQEEEPTLDPLVWEFLDAGSHEQRLNILAALHHRITDDMITTMAVACDVEVSDGDIEERYSQLKNCLIMLDRFEIKRSNIR